VQFNTGRKPFDDVRVRRALSMAIDREIMAAKVLRAGERPAYSLVPPGMPNYPGKAQFDFKTIPQTARLDKAKELLAQAGFSAANPLSFDYNMQNTTEAKMVAVALQAMWKDAGVNVRLVPSETQIHYDLLRKRDFAVAWAGWVADYRDPKNYLFLFQSTTRDLNYGDYASAKYDQLIDASDQERSVPKRSDLLQLAEQLLLDEAGISPVYFGVTRDLVSTQVNGWVSNNVNINRSRYLSIQRSVVSA
jgi:oligopeptide transport system substrate-binding protein